MRVRIEERDPQRLCDLARAWGVKAIEGQHPDVLAVAIATAYRRQVEKEDKDHAR
jgi:hypothetical protein